MSEQEAKATETAAANGEGKPNGKDRKRDETPIEDLYDLSQPIPRVSCLTFERLMPRVLWHTK